MKRFLVCILTLLVPFLALAQQYSIEIDKSSFKPVHIDALTGVPIDKIEPDFSQRPCARIKLHVNRMSEEEIKGISVKVIGGNVVVMKRLVAAEGTGLIIELTAKPETSFYLHHDKFGDSNKVTLKLEGDKEYRLNAQLVSSHTIVVNSDVIGAEIYVDNVLKGRIGDNHMLTISDIQPGTHKIKIQNGNLNNEITVNVSSRNVSFRLELSEEQTQPQYAIFKIEPKEATITVDGKPLSVNDGVAHSLLGGGSHSYTISANEYYTEKGTFTINGNKFFKEVKLRPAFGFLSIPANEDLVDAGVYVDNSLVGKVPLNNHKIANGTHSIRIVKDLYKANDGTIVIKEGEVTEYAPALVADYAEIRLTTGTGFDIYINDELKGSSSWSGKVATGTHIFEARKEGYRPSSITRTINLDSGGQTIAIPAPKPVTGALNIMSSPIMAEVHVDGKLVGETPIMLNLTIGKHTMSVRKEGYSNSVEEMNIVEGQVKDLNITLNRGIKILYTSSDGCIITPQEGVFDANIVSNTYVGGQGVIEFDKSITKIADFGFKNCTTLTSIVIPDRVTTIGFEAFYNCTSLQKIVIGNGVTSFGRYAFYGCKSLSSVEIRNGITEIGDETFRGCTSLTSITLPNSVKKIGERAFYGCSYLASITIGKGVAQIGKGAFNSCDRLKAVYISDLSAWCKIDNGNYDANPLSRGARLYINGIEARNITIPSDITSIKFAAFYNCPSLTSVIIPNSVTTISKSAFNNCSSLTDISISNSVTSIKEYAFCECKSLSNITIPNSVTMIGEKAFYGCKSLTKATIGNSVTTIGKEAFNSCNSLTRITIPDSVTTIGESAFCYCSSLLSATIGKGVSKIGSYAFYECRSLNSVYCKATTPPKLGDGPFNYNARDRKIYVPTSSVEIYKAAYYNYNYNRWSEYSDSIVGYDF